ncbi:pseudouridine synthase [Nafulsella turpanensis]|uniref:pseudouridine synthase n=1 Tax=Nafulsella turpanensis TaxID=1265690 RepID=UPI00036A0361|nr:pseudouridine synthase [Nafulsella turpanensis]
MSKFKGKFSKKKDYDGERGSFEGKKPERPNASKEGKDRSGKYRKKNFRDYTSDEDGRRKRQEDLNTPNKPSGDRRREGGRASGRQDEGRRPASAAGRTTRKADRSTPFQSKEEPMQVPPTYDVLPTAEKKEKVSADEKNIRLNKYIADAGVCSRREADKLIEAGEVKVNGQVVTELGTKVSRKDVVTYNGKKLSAEKLVYVLLNKPKDFITTMDDPDERKTVMQLVNNAGHERIYPVGRLDRNTTGLLLLTNDGELTKRLSHPSHMVKKIYQVDLNKPLEEEDFEKIQAGLQLEDGEAKVDEIAILSADRSIVGVEIHIGRNRIVRRIFEHLGYEVIRLDRVMYAGLTKKDLPRGKWRYLTQKELIRLKHFK